MLTVITQAKVLRKMLRHLTDRKNIWQVWRDKHDRMFPSPKMGISIRAPDTCCLIFTCKIPANSL
jgi:hypothetical protein